MIDKVYPILSDDEDNGTMAGDDPKRGEDNTGGRGWD